MEDGTPTFVGTGSRAMDRELKLSIIHSVCNAARGNTELDEYTIPELCETLFAWVKA